MISSRCKRKKEGYRPVLEWLLQSHELVTEEVHRLLQSAQFGAVILVRGEKTLAGSSAAPGLLPKHTALLSLHTLAAGEVFM